MGTHTLKVTTSVNHNGSFNMATKVTAIDTGPDFPEFDLSENVIFMLKHVAHNVSTQWNDSPRLINVFEDWQNGSNSFDSKVLSLIQHADSENRKLIAAVYPVHVALFENMYHGCREQLH